MPYLGRDLVLVALELGWRSDPEPLKAVPLDVKPVSSVDLRPYSSSYRTSMLLKLMRVTNLRMSVVSIAQGLEAIPGHYTGKCKSQVAKWIEN